MEREKLLKKLLKKRNPEVSLRKDYKDENFPVASFLISKKVREIIRVFTILLEFLTILQIIKIFRQKKKLKY